MDTKDIAQRYLDRAHNKQATRLYRVHVSASTTIRCSQKGQEARESKGPPLLLEQGQSMVTTAYAYVAVPSSGESGNSPRGNNSVFAASSFDIFLSFYMAYTCPSMPPCIQSTLSPPQSLLDRSFPLHTKQRKGDINSVVFAPPTKE